MVLRRLGTKLAMFLSVMGPGIVTAFADNDAGGIATYATAGAHYQYQLLGILLISTICLAVFQEMSARTGVVTGRGLSDLIRENYGVRWAFFAMAVLLIANIGTTASEFSGIASSFEMFGIHKMITVPLAALLIWFLVLKADYGLVEKVFFLLCFTFVSYLAAGVLIHPPWEKVLQAALLPEWSSDYRYILMAVGLVGTTITPWGQFYIQSSVVDKGLTAKDYRYTLLDVLTGTFFTGLIAFFVIVTTAAVLYGNHFVIETVKDAALALEPLAGTYAKALFAFGLLGASMLAAVILPLSTAYAVCEALGFEHGLSKSYQEAPVFFGLYTFLIFLGAGMVLIPGLSLYKIMLTSQVVNGVLLPPILIFMLCLSNDKDLMGRYKNPIWYQWIAWTFTILLIILNAALCMTGLFD